MGNIVKGGASPCHFFHDVLCQTQGMDIYMEKHNKFVDFTKDMKEKYTILAPDIFPMHMELLKEIFRMYGYRVEILHCTGKPVLDTGLKYIHNDMCYPAICSMGQQLYAITCGDYDPHKIALVQFQTGGGCRASNYIKLLRKALSDMGMGYIPVISLSFSCMEKYSGFKITLPMLYKGFISLAYGDMLMLLKNQVKPYELQAGDTQKVVKYWNEKLLRMFRHNKGLTGKSIKKNLKQIAEDFRNIKTKNEKKVKVGIVGEVYVKYSPFGNNNLEDILSSQDCEYMMPGVLGFVHYCLSGTAIDWELYGGSRLKKNIGKFSEKLVHKLETQFLDCLKEFPEFIAPSTFEELKVAADRVLNKGVKMGEGWFLPSEMEELIKKGYKNIICAQPFGCLPNHIVGKGVIRRFKELYPTSNICPIDYDASATKVNQENRIKLMLAVARENL